MLKKKLKTLNEPFILQSTGSFGFYFIFNYLFRISFFLSFVFVFCYFAAHTTKRIASIGETTYNSSWCEYPPELQKYVSIIILRSQRPSHFTGLGVFRCNLKTFCKVRVMNFLVILLFH